MHPLRNFSHFEEFQIMGTNKNKKLKIGKINIKILIGELQILSPHLIKKI